MENSLEYYNNNKSILIDVVQQFEKDVMLCGGHWSFPDSNEIDAGLLMETVKSFLSEISIKDKPLLFNLLYRIDIPQQLIESTIDDLTAHLLKRELLKVLLRKKYS